MADTILSFMWIKIRQYNGTYCLKVLDCIIFKTVLWGFCQLKVFGKMFCQPNNRYVVKQQYNPMIERSMLLPLQPHFHSC